MKEDKEEDIWPSDVLTVDSSAEICTWLLACHTDMLLKTISDINVSLLSDFSKLAISYTALAVKVGEDGPL